MQSIELTIVKGPLNGRRFISSGGNLVVGRGCSSDFVVHDPTISREHFDLVRLKSHWWLRDLGSCNGTLVNEETVQTRLLDENDLIRAGGTVFRIHYISPN